MSEIIGTLKNNKYSTSQRHNYVSEIIEGLFALQPSDKIYQIDFCFYKIFATEYSCLTSIPTHSPILKYFDFISGVKQFSAKYTYGHIC